MKKSQSSITKWTISTNKLLHDLFTISNTGNIKSKPRYDKTEIVTEYYVEFDCEGAKGCQFRVKISSTDESNVVFTIDELILYQLLISNARQIPKDDNGYFISMRKLREIRGLSADSVATYKCYEEAISRLCNKHIMVITQKATYHADFISCNMLNIQNIKKFKNRITEFTYSFGSLETKLVKNNQSITTRYNPFKYISKKYFMIEFSTHILRMISITEKEYDKRSLSFKRILSQIMWVDTDGIISTTSYYTYLTNSKNKQSSRLCKAYEDAETVLKQLVKLKIIQSYSITERRTYKYLRDDEVKITINFIR